MNERELGRNTANRREIIIVEDDLTLRTFLGDIVAEIGAKNFSFDIADEALTYLLQANEHCRLVIVDHSVPGQIQGT